MILRCAATWIWSYVLNGLIERIERHPQQLGSQSSTCNPGHQWGISLSFKWALCSNPWLAVNLVCPNHLKSPIACKANDCPPESFKAFTSTHNRGITECLFLAAGSSFGFVWINQHILLFKVKYNWKLEVFWSNLTAK